MSFDLTGRKALVTGASRGIGRAIALAFARHGADVAVAARSVEDLENVAAEIESLGQKSCVVPMDVCDEQAVRDGVDRAAEELDGLNVLVNNAGGNSFSRPLADMRFSGWQKSFALNVESTFLACQAAAPHLLASRDASVINMASVAGLRGAPLMSHYGASKSATLSLTQSLAIEWAWARVRVNALVPGWIETELTEFLRASPQTEQGVLARVPLQRWGTGDEIAEPAVFLASSASAFMTGQALVIDGGLSAMP